MASRTVAALFDTSATAHHVAEDLVAHGVSREAISIVGLDDRGRPDVGGTGEDRSATAVGAGTGALVGGLGGLVAGLGALAIPGIGPVIAAGPLAAALMGASVGAAAGGVIGLLVDVGVPESEARAYAEAIRRGGTLVLVHADEPLARRVTEIMARYAPVDMATRIAGWRDRGWVEFDPEAAPYTTEDLARERALCRRGEADPARRGDSAVAGTGYDAWSADIDADFRGHWAGRASGVTYEEASVAYRLGWGMATNPRYGRAEWPMLEPEARRQWEERAPGTWETYRDAIRHAWECGRQRRAA